MCNFECYFFTGSGGGSRESEKQKLSEGKASGSHPQTDEDGTVELIRRYLAEKLGFYSEERSTDSSEKPKVTK